MKYDASGQKPASANGFDPGVWVLHITKKFNGTVLETNLGPFQNEVLVKTASGEERCYQTALSIN